MEFISFFITKFLFVFGALLPIVDPLGLMPLFIGLTSHFTDAQRNYIARRVAIYSLFLLAGSMAFGGFILSFFGVTQPAVQLAGGFIILHTAWTLLQTGGMPPEPSATEKIVPATGPSRDALRQRAFYPITFPLAVGPGAISIAITLGAALNNSEGWVERYTLVPLASFSAIVTLALITWACLRYAPFLLKRIGATGITVFIRLLAFILLCLGVQIMWGAFLALRASIQ